MVFAGVVLILIGLGAAVLGLSMIFEWFSWAIPAPKVFGGLTLAGAAALVITGALKAAGVI